MTKRRANANLVDGRWLVISAWPPELAFLESARTDFSMARRARVTLASVGMGLVDAGIGTTRMLAEHKPDLLVFLGTAGVYPEHEETFPLGDPVVVEEISLLPEILPGKHAYLPSAMPSKVAASAPLVRAFRRATGLLGANVACPLGITRSAQAARSAGRLADCELENLEAFAVARAATAAEIPFVAILGVSNRVGPAGHREWKMYAASAAANACRAALVLLAQ